MVSTRNHQTMFSLSEAQLLLVDPHAWDVGSNRINIYNNAFNQTKKNHELNIFEFLSYWEAHILFYINLSKTYWTL